MLKCSECYENKSGFWRGHSWAQFTKGHATIDVRIDRCWLTCWGDVVPHPLLVLPPSHLRQGKGALASSSEPRRHTANKAIWVSLICIVSAKWKTSTASWSALQCCYHRHSHPRYCRDTSSATSPSSSSSFSSSPSIPTSIVSKSSLCPLQAPASISVFPEDEYLHHYVS